MDGGNLRCDVVGSKDPICRGWVIVGLGNEASPNSSIESSKCDLGDANGFEPYAVLVGGGAWNASLKVAIVCRLYP